MRPANPLRSIAVFDDLSSCSRFRVDDRFAFSQKREVTGVHFIVEPHQQQRTRHRLNAFAAVAQQLQQRGIRPPLVSTISQLQCLQEVQARDRRGQYNESNAIDAGSASSEMAPPDTLKRSCRLNQLSSGDHGARKI